MRHPHLRIERLRGDLLPQDRADLLAIVLHYFPKPDSVGEILDYHLKHSNTVILARLRGKVIGLSLASRLHQLTPYHSRPVNVVFQRALFVDPDVIYRGLGKRLMVATLRSLLGWFWFARRFALICRTQNPTVSRLLSKFTLMYPKPGERLPAEVLAFGQGLLPVLNATDLDEYGRLQGSLEEFKDFDHTEIWNHYYNNYNDDYENMMLDRAFTCDKGRVINTGKLIFFTAYAKPWVFLRYLFH